MVDAFVVHSDRSSRIARPSVLGWPRSFERCDVTREIQSHGYGLPELLAFTIAALHFFHHNGPPQTLRFL
jgi:hypothetical protein